MKHYFYNIRELYKELGLWEPLHLTFEVHEYHKAVNYISQHSGLEKFQCNFYQLSFLEAPDLKVRISGQEYIYREPCFIITCPENAQVWGKNDQRSKQKGFILFFDDTFLGINLKLAENQLKYPYFNLNNPFLFPVPASCVAEIVSLYQDMIFLQESLYPEKWELIQHYLQILMLKARFIYYQVFGESAYLSNHYLPVLKNYLTLLHTLKLLASFSITQIAEQLHIHPNYLNELCQRQLMLSASELKNIFIANQAKYLLNNPALSIDQIAQQLGFSSASSFGVFFKKMHKLTPSQFR